MSKQLKEEVEERLKPQLEKEGCLELFDKIATEENAEEPEALVAYLQEIGHPALEMEMLF
jgi:CO dehydrogenase/acetyl-CoA synthase beta subunit